MSVPIVFILGLGHSGSTLLDILLGSHPKGIGVGAARVLSTAAVVSRAEGGPYERPGEHKSTHPFDRLCTCQRLIEQCPFWTGVEGKLRQAHGMNLRDLDLGHEDDVAFQRHNRAFLDAVQAFSGASFVVDSSKGPLRLMRLSEAAFDLRIIHLIRDPRGVGYSAVKKGRSLLSVAGRHGKRTALYRRMVAGVDHYEVRYETLASDPWTTLSGIMTWLGHSLAPEQRTWGQVEHHQAAGNRMRLKLDGAIRVDDAWKHGLSYWERLSTKAVAGATHFLWSLPSKPARAFRLRP